MNAPRMDRTPGTAVYIAIDKWADEMDAYMKQLDNRLNRIEQRIELLKITERRFYERVPALDKTHDANHADRISALGAIRRAAEVARDMDDIAKVGQRKGEWVEAGHWNFRADAIRRAIRAAIRSPKA